MALATSVDRTAAVVTTEAYRLMSTDEPELRQRRLAWVWVLIFILVMVAAALAFVMCVNKGYRGFAGHWRFHTRFKVPIGIDLACY